MIEDPTEKPMADDVARRRQRSAFGSAVRSFRTSAGLSQERLARAAGLDRTYLGAVELGRRNISLHAMWQLANALHVTPAAFFSEADGAGQDGTEAVDRPDRSGSQAG